MWSMKWVGNHEVSCSNSKNTRLFLFIFPSLGRQSYQIPVLIGGSRYLVKLVKVRASGSGHHGYVKKSKDPTKPLAVLNICLPSLRK